MVKQKAIEMACKMIDEGHKNQEIANKVGFSRAWVSKIRVKKLGTKREYGFWTDKEIETLKRLVHRGLKDKEISEIMGRTVTGVAGKRRQVCSGKAFIEEFNRQRSNKFYKNRNYVINGKVFKYIGEYSTYYLFQHKNGYKECFQKSDCLNVKEERK